MHNLRTLLAIAAMLLCSVAYAVIPEAGLWAVVSEENGQPGRGFTIDVQPGILVMTFYGYLPSGQPQWYLAAGAWNGSTMTGSLEMYGHGQYLGGPGQSAQGTGSAGNATLSFTDTTHGTITLPGEPSKAIERVNFARPSGLDGTWTHVNLTGLTSAGQIVSPNTTAYSATLVISKGNYRIISQSQQPGSAPVATYDQGTIQDFGTSVVLTSSTVPGYTETDYVIKRTGDELILFFAGGAGSTVTAAVEYFQRTAP
jgi:hypothetical protein